MATDLVCGQPQGRERNKPSHKMRPESGSMESVAEKDHWILRRLLISFWRHGPLGTVKRVNTAMDRYFRNVPGSQRLFLSIDTRLHDIQTYLDSSIDRKFGTDTSGYIPLERLTIESRNAQEGIWYEPMSAKIFAQIMNGLGINWEEFDFIDFGSGKGRVLLLASNYGFRNVVGVEFSKELHQIATTNVALWNQRTRKRHNIMTVHMDATEYSIPNVPLVVFLYSPFRGETMARVLNNIAISFHTNPRQIVIVFYGANAETIEILKKMNFHWRELRLHADWSQFNKYRAFIFTALPHSGLDIR
ncbi:methyltransferase domain-containing protein [Inquilinus limosus]|uniref:class I SAM-dependent methyltransferase n=1 Tax=Inquilinus limosus TaxID=171674 RepID=UPI003F18B01C